MLTRNDIKSVSDTYVHLEEFVNRTDETGHFQSLVNKRYEERAKRIIAFYGPAGIGKTVLLDRLEFECLRRNIPFCRVNFEAGLYNNVIKILREMVDELDPKCEAFGSWIQKYQNWFSTDVTTTDVNINVTAQAGGIDFREASLSIEGDVFTGPKVEVGKVEVNLISRAAQNPDEAKKSLTESFIQSIGEFVLQRPAVIMFEGLDNKYCPVEIRAWVNDLLDKIRVLKGYGVLPVVTYFEVPNFEQRLRAVTLQKELKPLTFEYIVEYFRARRIPESIIEDAAKLCIQETQGIPLRVLEYTENNFPPVEEYFEGTLEGEAIKEIPAEQAMVPITQPEVQAEILESAVVIELSAQVEESLAVAPEFPVETIEDEKATIAQNQAPFIEIAVTEEQILLEEGPGEPEQESVPMAEAGSQAELREEVPPVAETVHPASEETKIEAERNLPIQETIPVGTEISKAEPVKALTTEQQESELTAQPIEEVKAEDVSVVPESLESVPTRAQDLFPKPVEETNEEFSSRAVSKEAVTGVEPETAALGEGNVSPVSRPSVQQPTDEAIKKSEEAFYRSQERLKRLMSEGKSSTAAMVDSLLERQSGEVVEIAHRCAVLRWFTADLLQVIADKPLSSEQAAEILNTITGWRFVQNFGYGTYAYRREVQQYLITQLQQKNPGLYLQINRRAQAYFEKKLGTVDFNNEMAWVNLQSDQITALRENLYYLLHVDVSRGFDLLGKLFQGAQRLHLDGEAAILLKFVDEIDKSSLGDHYLDRLSYYEASLEFAEGDAGSAESKLRSLLGKRLDDELSAQVQGALGRVCAAGGRYDEAIKLFEQAQKYWQKLKRERERAKLSNNLGNVYMRKGDLNRAERSFNDALSGLKKLGTPAERAQTLNNLGNVYQQKENYSKALDQYNSSLAIKLGVGDQFGAATTYANLGTVSQRMAQQESGKKQTQLRQLAAEYYTRSLKTYETFGARSNQGRLFFKLALLYTQTGDKTNARVFLGNALEIFRELEMPELENASKLEKQLA